MTIFYPEDSRHWNGKLYMTAHGAGSYGAIGTLMPRIANAKFNSLSATSIGTSTLLIDKGYAVSAYDEVLRQNARGRHDYLGRWHDS